MKWQLTDVRGPAAASGASATIKSRGEWWHATSVDQICIANGTRYAFDVNHLPQTVTTQSLGDAHAIASIVHPGTSGVVDGMAAPWAQRLRIALDICERCETPCVAVMDAPESSEIVCALAELSKQKERIKALLGGTKLLVLTLPWNTTYPVLEERQVTYSQKPAESLRADAEWGLQYTIRGSASDTGRLHDVFTTMLGYMHTPTGPYTSTATYPDEFTLPKEVFDYMTFSSNVVPGSARASRTRGISATTTDGKAWHATVILQSNTLATETQTMCCVRLMLTATDAAEIGGSYFALAAGDNEPIPVIRRIMSDVYRKHTSKCRGLSVGPLCRAASHHRSWD